MMTERQLSYHQTPSIKEFPGVLGIDSEWEYKEYSAVVMGVRVVLEGWEKIAEAEGVVCYRRRKAKPESASMPKNAP